MNQTALDRHSAGAPTWRHAPSAAVRARGLRRTYGQAALSAAGCRLAVVGDATQVPTALHEAAAWVVREGTTNIVRHSSAAEATLMLGRAGMSLRNDGVVGTPRASSGLRGLAERLAAVGASVSTVVRGDEFILDIRWETP